MRVLIFSTAYFPFVGGAEVAIKEITDRLGGEIEFDLITAKLRSDIPKVERFGKVNIYRIGFGLPLLDKLLLPFLGALKVLKLHRAKPYDYFWGVMISFASGAAYVFNLFRKNKVPIILTLQEGDSEEHLTKRWFGLINKSWKLALARTERLTAISTYLLERAHKLGFEGEGHLIPNGVDLKRFELLRKPAFDLNRIILITTSRLVPKNGIIDIIRALKYLPETVQLQILGSGPLEGKLKNEAKHLKPGRVIFLGSIPQDEIPAYLQQADIFVRPSLSEGQGISFLEAMAAGVPVVATPVGGIPDFLRDGETGVFCKPNDPESVAEAVLRLIDNSSLRGRVVTNALLLVREKYDWDTLAQEMKLKVFKI